MASTVQGFRMEYTGGVPKRQRADVSAMVTGEPEGEDGIVHAVCVSIDATSVFIEACDARALASVLLAYADGADRLNRKAE